jgi:hypothetical protein
VKNYRAVGPQDFVRFLAWLDTDPKRAGALFNEFQRKLTVYFAGRGCGMAADDLASEVLDRTTGKFLDGGGIEDREPAKYIFQVARFVLLEHFKRPPQVPLMPDIPVAAPPIHEQHELLCCKQCLDKLSEQDRVLVQDYYQGDRKGEAKRIRGDVANDFSLLRGTLRVKVFRLKLKIMKCIAACVERVAGCNTSA